MKGGFVLLRGGHCLRTQLLVDQRHTAEGIISLGWLMMASTHRCLSCLSWGCLGVRLTLAPLPSLLWQPADISDERHSSPQRHQVSDKEEWPGKSVHLVPRPWESVGGERVLGGGQGAGWASGFVKIRGRERVRVKLFCYFLQHFFGKCCRCLLISLWAFEMMALILLEKWQHWLFVQMPKQQPMTFCCCL